LRRGWTIAVFFPESCELRKGKPASRQQKFIRVHSPLDFFLSFG